MLLLSTRRQLRKEKKLSVPKRSRLREITTLGSPSRNILPKRKGKLKRLSASEPSEKEPIEPSEK